MGERAPDAPLRVWQADLPWIDPHVAAAAFADAPALALLDSTGPVTALSRFSYLCVDPFEIIAVPAQRAGGGFDAMEAALAGIGLSPDAEGMPFRGGLAGFVGYEAGAVLEGIAAAAAEPDAAPAMFMGAYDLVIGFDRAERRCRVHATGLPARQEAARARRAGARLDFAARRIGRAAAPAMNLPRLAWQADWTEADYGRRLDRLLGYIAAGDIFQANLTVRHQAARPPGLDDWAVHAALRQANPAPFGAWLRYGGHALCCSSPERFVRLGVDRTIETRPIKGTAPRDADPRLDALALAALCASAKDRAENVMIVDVLRNDVGRVAAVGSMRVPELCAPHSFASLHHLISTVQGCLRPGIGPVDVLRAALPGGSITGAPKIRAMQIIAELEERQRGPYCGTVVAIGFDGFMDSNIVIRSIELTPGRVIAQSGGGIVADSTAVSEYNEMLAKSAPMRGVFGPGA